MKITIEVEPVLRECKHQPGTYYGFRIIDLSDGQFIPSDVIMATSGYSYPGNEAVRAFINAAALKKEAP